MRKLSIAITAALMALAVALTGCGGGGGGGTKGGGDTPTPTTYTVTGKVIRSDTKAGVGNVKVIFGTSSIAANTTAITKSDGTFTIDTKATSALNAYENWTSWPPTFTVSTENLDQTYYPTSYGVIYTYYPSTVTLANPNGSYQQNAVRVPDEILNGSTSSLGTIQVFYLDPNDPNPPPPPY